MAKDTSTENEAPEGYLVASDQFRIVADEYSVGHCANGKSTCHRLRRQQCHDCAIEGVHPKEPTVSHDEARMF